MAFELGLASCWGEYIHHGNGFWTTLTRTVTRTCEVWRAMIYWLGVFLVQTICDTAILVLAAMFAMLPCVPSTTPL